MTIRQTEQDPAVAAGRKRARHLAWWLGLVAVGLYLLFFLTGGGGMQ